MTIIRGESLADYHAHKAVSHSMLRDYEDHGAKGYFLRYLCGGHDRDQTKAMAQGQRLEDFIGGVWKPVVRPATLPDENGEVKPWHGNRKVCKQWEKDHPGCISHDELKALKYMREAVMSNKAARSIIERAEAQVTLRSPHPFLPHGTQSRPDFLLLDDAFLGPVYLDLKKTSKLKKFRKWGVHDFGCNTQAGFAHHHLKQEGITGVTYYLLVVEEEFPQTARLMNMTERTVLTGEKWCLDKCRELAEHYESGEWSDPEVEQLDAPVRGVELEDDAA